MKKRILATILTTTMLVLTACGATPPTNTEPDVSLEPETTVTAETEEETETKADKRVAKEEVFDDLDWSVLEESTSAETKEEDSTVIETQTSADMALAANPETSVKEEVPETPVFEALMVLPLEDMKAYFLKKNSAFMDYYDWSLEYNNMDITDSLTLYFDDGKASTKDISVITTDDSEQITVHQFVYIGENEMDFTTNWWYTYLYNPDVATNVYLDNECAIYHLNYREEYGDEYEIRVRYDDKVINYWVDSDSLEDAKAKFTEYTGYHFVN